MSEEGKTNQWHEQADFSSTYFKAGETCRLAQGSGNSMAWRYALDAKLSIAMGILTDDEKKKISEYRKKIETFMDGAAMVNKAAHQKRYSSSSNVHNFMANEATLQLYNLLFEVESVLDTLVNKRMPFLNLKKKSDLQGL